MDLARSYQGQSRKPRWFLVHEQTQGRGRMGRAWQAPIGNFSATLLLFPNCPPMQAALYSFVAACALHRTLSHFVEAAQLSHKWPNDVLLEGKKVAGILLESQAKQDTVERLSIGVGVNLAATPQGVENALFPPIGLADILGHPVDSIVFLERLSADMKHYQQLMVTQGFDAIRKNWLTYAAHLGQIIEARGAKCTHKGRFETIGEDGSLILRAGDTKITIASADVLF